MSLSEFLLVYVFTTLSKESGFNILLSKKQTDMRGTRPEVEAKLLEILYSLKYYSTRWLRAKLFAEMAGFLTTYESTAKILEVNSHLRGKNEGL